MSETPDFMLPSDQRGGDSAIPRFYVKPVQNNFKSKEEGRPIFDDMEFVEILIPGDRRSTWDGMVKEEHRRRWPAAYAAFKAGLEAPSEGTPLREWPGVTRSQAEELVHFNVKTVEALANLSDDQLSKTLAMGGFVLREKAQRYLEQAKGAAPAEKLAAENAELRANIERLNGEVAAFRARLAELEAGRGDAGAPPTA